MQANSRVIVDSEKPHVRITASTGCAKPSRPPPPKRSALDGVGHGAGVCRFGNGSNGQRHRQRPECYPNSAATFRWPCAVEPGRHRPDHPRTQPAIARHRDGQERSASRRHRGQGLAQPPPRNGTRPQCGANARTGHRPSTRLGREPASGKPGGTASAGRRGTCQGKGKWLRNLADTQCADRSSAVHLLPRLATPGPHAGRRRCSATAGTGQGTCAPAGQHRRSAALRNHQGRCRNHQRA